MSKVGIETAQNVVILHEVASVGDRMVAYLIDGLVKAAWIVFWLMLFFILEPKQWGETGIITFWVLVWLPTLFYGLACELLMDGKSIGKIVMKIKVARIDGAQPALGQYLLRWLTRPLDNFYGLGLVVLLINGKGQRIGDLAAGTTVVSLKQRTRLDDTLLAATGEVHQVRFPEAVRLTDAQAALVKEVLSSKRIANRMAMVDEMAAKVRAAIGVSADGMSNADFLAAVLRDFVHLTGQQGAGSGHYRGERATSPSPAAGEPR